MAKIAPSLGIPYFWLYIIIPIGCTIGIIFLLYRLAKVIQGIAKGKKWQDAILSCMAVEDEAEEGE